MLRPEIERSCYRFAPDVPSDICMHLDGTDCMLFERPCDDASLSEMLLASANDRLLEYMQAHNDRRHEEELAAIEKGIDGNIQNI